MVFYVAGLERKFVAAALVRRACSLRRLRRIQALPLARIIGFFDPEYKLHRHARSRGQIKKYVSQSMTTRDTGYQVRQSKIAVGSGGVLGLGLMQGKQKMLYLPEAHTDFIYAVVGEELGLFGCGALLVGFWSSSGAACNLLGGARRFRPLPGAGRHVVHRGPGADQHERGARHGAHQGNSAADDQRRRQFAAEHADLLGMLMSVSEHSG